MNWDTKEEELEIVKDLLSKTPEEQVLTRISLKGRIKEIKEEIEDEKISKSD